VNPRPFVDRLRWYELTLVLVLSGSLLAAALPFFARGGMRWLHVLGTAWTLSFLATPLIRKAALRWKILDRPGGHKAHSAPTPLLGGVAVFAGFSVALILNGIFTASFWLLLASAFILFLLGAADDALSLPASWKLWAQIGLAFLLVVGGFRIQVFPESHPLIWPVNLLVSVFWIVGVTNAMNFLDGMDGLAAGLSAIISFFMGIVALRMDVPLVGWACLAMLGASLGFLPYNFRPGRKALIFLGDAGSTVMGFLLAVLAIASDWADLDPLVSLVSPLLIFGVLIFDMCYITLSRILGGQVKSFRQWIDYVGHDHLHHRFRDVLGGPARSVLFIYTLSICLGMNALLLPRLGLEGALILLGQSLLILAMVSILEVKYRNDHSPPS